MRCVWSTHFYYNFIIIHDSYDDDYLYSTKKEEEMSLTIIKSMFM